MRKFVFTVIVFFFIRSFLTAQILNVESQRILQDSAGWVGKGDLSFNFTSNQKQVLDLSSSLHIQYRKNKNTFILLGGAGMIRADKNDFDNSGHIHFRYNRHLNDWLTLEAFAQGQYNRVLMIDHRELVGAGPRFKLSSHKNHLLSAAILYMLENELLVDESSSTIKHRLSSYLAYNLMMNDNISLHNIIYFQPRIQNFKDHRIMLQSNLKFRITKIIGFSLSFNLLDDSNPPPGVKKLVYSIRNVFEIRL